MSTNAVKIKHRKISVRAQLYKPKILKKKELAAPPYKSRYSKKSLQKHIEGSETDHIERGLQNQYQRCVYHPEMLYG